MSEGEGKANEKKFEKNPKKPLTNHRKGDTITMSEGDGSPSERTGRSGLIPNPTSASGDFPERNIKKTLKKVLKNP